MAGDGLLAQLILPPLVCLIATTFALLAYPNYPGPPYLAKRYLRFALWPTAIILPMHVIIGLTMLFFAYESHLAASLHSVLEPVAVIVLLSFYSLLLVIFPVSAVGPFIAWIGAILLAKPMTEHLRKDDGRGERSTSQEV